jgi:hypothetical protein
MAQHTVGLDGIVSVAKQGSQLEVMHLMYLTYGKVNMPYATTKTLEQILFDNSDKTITQLSTIVTSFYAQKGYTVNNTVLNKDTGELDISLQLNETPVNLSINI